MDALLPRHPSAALDVVTCSPGPAALLNAELANAARHGQPLRAFDSFKDRQVCSASYQGNTKTRVKQNLCAQQEVKAHTLFPLQGTASGLLEPKAGALDAVPFDSWKAQPVDKIPATSAAADGCVPTVGLRSWQFAVTGKLAAAQVLADLEAKHITNGEAAVHQLYRPCVICAEQAFQGMRRSCVKQYYRYVLRPRLTRTGAVLACRWSQGCTSRC